MLVLRRRPLESILFDGGIKLTVAGLADHRAWIALSAPALESDLVLSVASVSGDSACIAIQGPASVRREGAALEITTEAGDSERVLLVNRRVGEPLRLPGLTLSVSAIEHDRALLRLELAGIAGPIGLSVFPVAGAEVKIGIEAPEHIRVFRQEVFEELAAANTGASEQWSESDLASLSAGQRRR